MQDADLVTYYARRAHEYENIYQKPERQTEIARASEFLQQEFAGRDVYEIACGTGYWTAYISQTAKSIWATDINPEVIAVARAKTYPRSNVTFDVVDLYQSPASAKNALFAGFLWSHIPVQNLDFFLDVVQAKIERGIIVFMDNLFVAGNSTPISKTDEYGNTYQERLLTDGTKYMVLKNFPSKENVFTAIQRHHGTNIRLHQWEYYWIVCYEKPVVWC